MNKYIIFVALIFPLFIFSQTKIDENITIEFPGKTETLENATKEAKAKAYYLNSKEDSYFAMRVETLINTELPKSAKELHKDYIILTSEHLKSMAKKGLFLKDSTQIKLDNYIVYKLIFKEKNSEKESGESLILYLNGITYTFIYSKVQSYNMAAKEKFFNSIKINNSENIKQIAEPYNYFIAFSKLLACILSIVLIRWAIRREKKMKRIT